LTDWLQGSRLLRRFFLSFSDPSWADDPRNHSFIQFPSLLLPKFGRVEPMVQGCFIDSEKFERGSNSNVSLFNWFIFQKCSNNSVKSETVGVQQCLTMFNA
jgi:hypothetical protein